MKNRTIIISALLLAALAAYLYYAKNKVSTIKEELRNFAVADTTAISKIFLAEKSGAAALLEKQAPGHWTINGKFKARNDAINVLLTTMMKLDVYSPVSESGVDNVIKSLASKGTKVEIYLADKGKPTKVYYVGGPTQSQLGTFMILENSSKPFVMYIPGFNGYLSTRYFTKESEWRARDLFQYGKGEIIALYMINYEKPEQSFGIIYESPEEITLLDADSIPVAGVDKQLLLYYLSKFENVSLETYDYSVRPALRDSLVGLGPTRAIGITRVDGSQKLLRMYKMPVTSNAVVKEDKDGNPLTWDVDRMYGMIDNNETLVVLQYYAFKEMLREGKDFVPPKPSASKRKR